MPTKHRKLRKRLHAENPNCRKCNQPTSLELIHRTNGALRWDVATIEHIHPKGHPDRNLGIKTLYCYKCNKDAAEYYFYTGELYSDFDGVWDGSTKRRIIEEYNWYINSRTVWDSLTRYEREVLVDNEMSWAQFIK